MNGKEFLETAYDIAVELYPEQVSEHPINLDDRAMEAIISELENRTGYVRKPEFRPQSPH